MRGLPGSPRWPSPSGLRHPRTPDGGATAHVHDPGRSARVISLGTGRRLDRRRRGGDADHHRRRPAPALSVGEPDQLDGHGQRRPWPGRRRALRAGCALPPGRATRTVSAERLDPACVLHQLEDRGRRPGIVALANDQYRWYVVFGVWSYHPSCDNQRAFRGRGVFRANFRDARDGAGRLSRQTRTAIKRRGVSFRLRGGLLDPADAVTGTGGWQLLAAGHRRRERPLRPGRLAASDDYALALLWRRSFQGGKVYVVDQLFEDRQPVFFFLFLFGEDARLVEHVLRDQDRAGHPHSQSGGVARLGVDLDFLAIR